MFNIFVFGYSNYIQLTLVVAVQIKFIFVALGLMFIC